MKINDIRNVLAKEFLEKNFIKDKTGQNVIELIGSNFIADEEYIFGEVNYDYVEKEIAWYNSTSRSVYAMDNPPKIWQQIADKDGMINSNYGWCIFSEENKNQYKNCLQVLLKEKETRRAIMIYTRPEMQYDYNKNGMSDFMCTNTVQYLIRNNKLNAIVNMRSNDVFAGFRNDFAWQKYVIKKLLNDINNDNENDNIKLGDIIWNVGSLHLYQTQFYLIDHFIKTGETHITKKEYQNKYGVE
jgi:thymidylate synthase